MKGQIVKIISDLHFVKYDNKIYPCKCRGILRHEHITPLVGEYVLFDENELIINEILPRKNELIRPAVANIDQALLIFAINKPEPNYNLLDRFLIMMRQQGLECILCFNKKSARLFIFAFRFYIFQFLSN